MRILFATDGSPEATEAASWLLQFPVADDADVTVVSAVTAPTLPLTDRDTMALWRIMRGHAEQAVADARARLAVRWPRVGGSVLDGDPREAIPDAAGVMGVDLIVIGSRGLGAVKSAVLGSVSLAVARRAPCAVLVCHGRARPVRRVTIALDGSEPAREALHYFERLPLPVGLGVELVAAIEPIRYPTALPEVDGATVVRAMEDYERAQRETLGQMLSGTADSLRGGYGNVVLAMPLGTPATAIVQHAADAGSDLIVVGARGLGALKRLVLGSVSESVLRQSTCPVLVVRTRH